MQALGPFVFVTTDVLWRLLCYADDGVTKVNLATNVACVSKSTPLDARIACRTYMCTYKCTRMTLDIRRWRRAGQTESDRNLTATGR